MDSFKNFQNKKAMFKEEKRHQVLEQRQRKKTKQDQGITLVALVVTIIVLLILAGIVISMVTGSDGILGRSKNSINNYRVAETNENSTMKDYENEIDKIDGEGDSEEEVKVNGSSSDWEVNEAGDTIIAYIGGPISSDTMVIPNYVDDKKIVKLGDDSGRNRKYF